MLAVIVAEAAELAVGIWRRCSNDLCDPFRLNGSNIGVLIAQKLVPLFSSCFCRRSRRKLASTKTKFDIKNPGVTVFVLNHRRNRRHPSSFINGWHMHSRVDTHCCHTNWRHLEEHYQSNSINPLLNTGLTDRASDGSSLKM